MKKRAAVSGLILLNQRRKQAGVQKFDLPLAYLAFVSLYGAWGGALVIGEKR